MSKSASKSARDNRANQLNPTHSSYWRSRGASPQEAESRADQAHGADGTPARPASPGGDVSGQSLGTSSTTSPAKSG